MRLGLLSIYTLFLIYTLSACIAPRGNIHSGRVTQRGHFKVGYDMTTNLPSNTFRVTGKQVAKEISSTQDDDGNYQRDDLFDYGQIALAQSLDPIGMSSQFYLRYGVYDRLDLGVAYGSAGFIFDTAFQFLKAEESIFDGSVGVQYSGQSFSLTSLAGQAQELLGYEFSRDDVLLRGVLSVPFGENEEFGAFGFGAVLNYTALTYGFDPDAVSYLTDNQEEILTGVTNRSSGFFSYGGFINVKGGYQQAYLVLSLSVYYQQYGDYQLPDSRVASFDGYTFVPSFGIQGSL